MTDAAPTRDRILVEMTIAAPADEVWDALKDPAKIYNWHGWDDPSLKEEIEFIYVTHARHDDDAKIMRFEGFGDRFEVEARGDKSVLRVVRAMPADAEWSDVYEDMVEGWISFVEQLRFGLERHDLGARRALYLSGCAKPGGSAPIAALGLTRLRDAEPGEGIDAVLPTGEKMGEVWHHNNWQIGVTMPDWGDGLLIVTDKSVTDTSPDGRGALILTVYGFDDAAFADLESRWRGWWDAHYDKPGEAACS
ncbi:MAG: SRPBCC family protein [Sphingosinicella sp.]|uniref:SRPBCC family protein n=1 Tax=Sphingosinicella sp. TaxID=1917971 RepID=UPI0040377B00